MTFPEDAEVMVRVAKCESGLRQFNSKGEVIVSPTKDFGLMQINQKVWNKTAEDMGLDYKGNIEDNLKLARHIYDVQGKRAWVCYQNMVK